MQLYIMFNTCYICQNIFLSPPSSCVFIPFPVKKTKVIKRNLHCPFRFLSEEFTPNMQSHNNSNKNQTGGKDGSRAPIDDETI